MVCAGLDIVLKLPGVCTAQPEFKTSAVEDTVMAKRVGGQIGLGYGNWKRHGLV